METKSNQNELIRICMIYRFISLAISTSIYFFMCNGEITPIRLGITLGMISASLIGAYIYKRTFSDTAQAGVMVTMCLETMAYGLFIFVSGGFSSPYLWYFISAMTIVMAVGHYDRRIKVAAPLFVVWGFLCALAGEYCDLSQAYTAYPAINTAIAFLMVAIGFYILLVYAGRLNESRQELNKINESLRQETMRGEQALRHTMDIYESFNLFSITDPGKVVDEVISLLCRTIAPGGCLLLRVDPLQGLEPIGCRGLSERQKTDLVQHVKELDPTDPHVLQSENMEAAGSRYAIARIRNQSGIQGILLMPDGQWNAAKPRNPEQESFYLNLAGIIMQELDLQSMAESYIISEEQNRIANEIHDTVIQKLFSIACNLRLLDEGEGELSPLESREQLSHIAKAVESTMRELREAIYGLRWDVDAEDLFADKLASYLDEVKHLSGADISLVLENDTQLMTSNQKTAFYRIVCEAVNNAVRHGGAAKVSIKIRQEAGWLTAEIIDNGAGFDQRRLPAEGQGLKNMYKITGLLKGQLFIDSKIGKGTSIRCSLPNQ